MSGVPSKFARSCYVLCFSVLLFSSIAAAQNPQVAVMQLNQQAMNAYGNLEFPNAMSLLQQAEAMCQQNNLQGNAPARTYINMGIVEYGGNGNSAGAMEFFKKALCLDPQIMLDPLNSTPDMEMLFTGAKNQVQAPGICASLIPQATTTTPPGPTTPTTPPQGETSTNNVVKHTPVTQQKEMNPIPIYAMTNPAVDVKSVVVYYRTIGERIFQQIPMTKHDEQGWAATIGCDVLTTFEPTGIDYYIAVLDPANQLLATAGTEAQPFQISIVQVLTTPAPALPNTPPPDQCQRECPPWNPDCNKTECKEYGDACNSNSECCDGMVCEDGACEPGEGAPEDPGATVDNKVRIVLNAGTGFGLVSGGSYDNSDFGNMVYTEEVEVPTGMALSKLHFRLGVMFPLPVDKLEVGLTFRGDLPLSPDYDALAPSVIANAAYQIAGANKVKGFQLYALFGFGWMNIMHRIPFDDCATVNTDGTCTYDDWYTPERNDINERSGFRKAGFLGVEAGMDMYFWLSKAFGFNVGAIFDVTFPTFALNLDIQGGIALRF